MFLVLLCLAIRALLASAVQVLPFKCLPGSGDHDKLHGPFRRDSD